MANKTFFDFWTDPKVLDIMLNIDLTRQRFTGMFANVGASAAVFTVPRGIGGQQIFPPRHPSGAPMNPVRVIDHATMLPDPKKQRQVMQWLFTIVAPDGCPTCKNPTDGAWTCAQDFLTETYVLHCDECEWSERVTAEAIADFVMGRREDPREFDTCACGRRKRKLHKLCSECAEAAKWDVCACGVKKSVFQTQCPDCREAARWDACTCGVKKLKTEQVCSECKLAEVQFGTLVAIERGGLLECLKR